LSKVQLKEKGILILGYELSHQEYIAALTAAGQSVALANPAHLGQYFLALGTKSYGTMAGNILKAVDEAPQQLKDRYGSQLNEVKKLENIVNPMFLANSLATYIATGESMKLPKINTLSKFGVKSGVLSYTRAEKLLKEKIPLPNTHQPYILVTLPEVELEADSIVANNTKQYDQVATNSKIIQAATDLSLADPNATISDTYAAIATSYKTGSVGYSWGYNTNQAAEKAAIEACKSEDCKTRSWVGNQFLSIVYDEDYKIYLGANPLSTSASEEALKICKEHAEDPSSCTVTKVIHSKEGITQENPLPRFRTGSLDAEWPYTTFTYENKRKGGQETILLLTKGGEPIARQTTVDRQVFDYPVYIGEKDYIILKYNISKEDRYYIKLNLDGSSQWTAGQDMYKNGWLVWASNGTWSSRAKKDLKSCIAVDSTKEWQTLTLQNVGVGLNIEGGWTVDKANYSKVDYVGHVGEDAVKLEPYSQYKYDLSFPFGALLVDIPNEGVKQAVDTLKLPSLPVGSKLKFRINDTAFGDNDGFLTVCVGEAVN
jgi:hypothetical protein